RQDVERLLGVEMRLVVYEDRGARVPGREEAAPGVLRPARRADVPMDVVRPQADPIHGREMADGIALVRVQHHLGLRRRAGREVEEEWIAGAGRPVRLEKR